jgi:nucleotide-binding universal stress UspA family protein
VTCPDKKGAHLVAYAYKLAKEHDAQLQIAYRDTAEEHKDYADWPEFRNAIKELLPFEIAAKPNFHVLFLEDSESNSVVQTALSRQVDLVILGIRHQFIDWSLLRTGGNIPRLLTEAPCPLLAVPIQFS